MGGEDRDDQNLHTVKIILSQFLPKRIRPWMSLSKLSFQTLEMQFFHMSCFESNISWKGDDAGQPNWGLGWVAPNEDQEVSFNFPHNPFILASYLHDIISNANVTTHIVAIIIPFS